MVQSSQDTLLLVLAIAIALLTIALVWLIVEAALCLHRVNRVVREFRQKFVKIEAAVLGIRDKLEHSAGYLSLLATVAKQLVNTFMLRRKKKKH